MKKLKILMAAAVAAAMLFSSAAVSSAEISGGKVNTAYADKNGEKLIGWQEIDGKLYYFNKNGEPVTKPKIIGGIRYTFSPDGVCTGKYTGFTKTVQGKRYWKDGKPVEYEWITVDGKKYYASGEGFVCTGNCLIGDCLYEFNKDGVWSGKKTKLSSNKDRTLKGVLSKISLNDIVSVTSDCYDEEKGSKSVFSEDKELLARLWKSLTGLKRGKKLADSDEVYFNALGVNASEPVQYFSLQLKDGRELSVMFAFLASGEKCICMDLHGKKNAGKLFFLYDYAGTYICDYTDLMNTAAELFSDI